MEFILKQECYDIIGACFEVHRVLGPGFLESVYSDALYHELITREIKVSREVKIEIYYKSIKLSKYYVADFICNESIILELKALASISTEHEAQILNYLKATKIKVGLLVNFGEERLKFRRYIF